MLGQPSRLHDTCGHSAKVLTMIPKMPFCRSVIFNFDKKAEALCVYWKIYSTSMMGKNSPPGGQFDRQGMSLSSGGNEASPRNSSVCAAPRLAASVKISLYIPLCVLAEMVFAE